MLVEWADEMDLVGRFEPLEKRCMLAVVYRELTALQSLRTGDWGKTPKERCSRTDPRNLALKNWHIEGIWEEGKEYGRTSPLMYNLVSMFPGA